MSTTNDKGSVVGLTVTEGTMSGTNDTEGLASVWNVTDLISDLNVTSSSRNSMGSPPGLVGQPRDPAALALMMYGLPALCCLGLLGNLVTVAAMSSRRMRGTSYSVYILAMAILDQVAIINALAIRFFRTLLHMKPLGLLNICNASHWYIGGSKSAAAWVVIAMTFERFLVIWNPLTARTTLSVRRATITVCSLVLVAYAVYIPALLVYSSSPDCIHRGRHLPGLVRWDWYIDYGQFILVTLTSTVVPSVGLIGLNGLVFFKLRQHLQATRELSSVATPMSARYSEVGRMVVITSVVYTLLTVPSSINMLVRRARGDWSIADTLHDPGQAVLALLFTSNHCINFYLYMTVSRSFRATVVSIFCLACQRLGAGNDKQVKSSDTVSSKLSSVEHGAEVEASTSKF